MQEFVGCKIEYDWAAAQMSFTQPILIQSLEDEFTLPGKRTGGTPAAPGTILQAYENEPMLNETEQTLFRKAVGKLWFLARISRHEILHAVRDASTRCARRVEVLCRSLEDHDQCGVAYNEILC
jgi:hypothetical protein